MKLNNKYICYIKTASCFHSQSAMEFGLGDALAVFDFTLSKCERLHRMVVNIEDNKRRSEKLSQRVTALKNLILAIKQGGHVYEPILSALQKLETSLVYAEFLLMKYSQTKGIKSLVRSNGFEIKFQDMNQRLNGDCFMLALNLLAEQREFLHKVYEMVLGGRIDQEPWSSPASPPVPLLVPRPLKDSVRVPFPSLLSPVQHHTAPGRIVALSSYYQSPRYASNFTSPSPNPLVSPTSPVYAISARAVLSLSCPGSRFPHAV